MKKLSGLSLEEIEDIVAELDGSTFRAKQIFNWIYLKSVKEISAMTDLSKNFREKLAENYVVTDVEIKQKQTSADGTIKYLVQYPDGACVETVLMRFDNRANLTACVSSQIGCACGCNFCATAHGGFVRNLSAEEIMEQVLTIQRDTGLKVTNIVFMGQGEPMLNLDNVLRAINIFNDLFQVGLRRITVSTCGIIPKIEEFGKANNQSTLAISLHAPNSEIRARLMPIDKKYPVQEVKKALQRYFGITGRRITIEYLMIDGVTDTLECAKELAEFLRNLKCNINLIPYNSAVNIDWRKSSKNAIMKFKYILEHSGKKVTIRLERGADIAAACGQLSGKAAQECGG